MSSHYQKCDTQRLAKLCLVSIHLNMGNVGALSVHLESEVLEEHLISSVCAVGKLVIILCNSSKNVYFGLIGFAHSERSENYVFVPNIGRSMFLECNLCNTAGRHVTLLKSTSVHTPLGAGGGEPSGEASEAAARGTSSSSGFYLATRTTRLCKSGALDNVASIKLSVTFITAWHPVGHRWGGVILTHPLNSEKFRETEDNTIVNSAFCLEHADARPLFFCWHSPNEQWK